MLVLCALFSLLVAAKALPQLKLGQTTISGRAISESIEFFGGIPFAEPPVGALRLHEPILKTRLETTTFNASDYGKACIQPLVIDPLVLSEDCLTISIHRPAGLTSTTRLPILFWTYGGAFLFGSSSQFNGSSLVDRSIKRGTPIIYVNFNYRLGPLGFPPGQEADDRRALNLGLKDQIAALRWVQANIHLFGGDKDKVTIFGESAGAAMTGILYLNPNILEKLARGAILESGSPNTLPIYPAARNERAWQDFVGRIPSCANISKSGATFSCLRNATTEQIQAAAMLRVPSGLDLNEIAWMPTLDKDGWGSVYPDYASRIYSRGCFARIPFIAGTNRDEGTLFVSSQPVSDAKQKSVLFSVHSPPLVSAAKLNESVDRLLLLYPDVPALGSPYGTGDQLFGLPSSYKRQASYTGDLDFVAPRRFWSETAAKFGVKSYGYHFTHPQNPPQLGVIHSAEMAYVYGQVSPTDAAGFGLSTSIMDYWISFTVSLNPNDGKGSKRPHWPLYKSSNRVLLQLQGGNTTVVKDDFREEQINFIINNANVFLR